MVPPGPRIALTGTQLEASPACTSPPKGPARRGSRSSGASSRHGRPPMKTAAGRPEEAKRARRRQRSGDGPGGRPRPARGRTTRTARSRADHRDPGPPSRGGQPPGRDAGAARLARDASPGLRPARDPRVATVGPAARGLPRPPQERVAPRGRGGLRYLEPARRPARGVPAAGGGLAALDAARGRAPLPGRRDPGALRLGARRTRLPDPTRVVERGQVPGRGDRALALRLRKRDREFLGGRAAAGQRRTPGARDQPTRRRGATAQ